MIKGKINLIGYQNNQSEPLFHVPQNLNKMMKIDFNENPLPEMDLLE